MSAVAAHSAPVLLWSSDLDGGCTWFNAGWLAFTGRSIETVVSSGWCDCVHPDDREARLAVQRRAAERGEPFEVEYRLLRHDGTWRWVVDRAVPHDDAGGCSGYVGACFDITERRREEKALLRSREDLRLALAAGSMGTWVWDRRTGQVTRDRNLQRLYGLDPDPTTGTFEEWTALVHPDDRDRVLSEVQRAVAEGGTYELQHRVVRPDGGVRWLERRGEAYRDEAGQVAGTRGLVIDITERKQAEEERNRLLAAEREARRAAELAAGRLARLQAVTAGLADAGTPEEVAEVVVAHGAEGLHSSTAVLCVLVDDGDELELVWHGGYDESSIERHRAFARDVRLAVSDAVRSGEMVLLSSPEERARRYPSPSAAPRASAAVAVVPLFGDGRPLGAIAFGWAAAREFDDDDRGFLTALSQQAAQALDRARFRQAERRRARRQSFLAEASRLLGSSLDYRTALGELAGLAVPAVADSCSIHLLEDGELRTVAAEHAGRPDDVGDRRAPRRWCLTGPELLDVATNGEALLVPRVDDEHRRRWADSDDHPEELNALGSRSVLAAPLRSGDERLGVVVVGTGISGRRYDAGDISFVEDVATRAAAAVANGRAHEARTAIALTLQHSLLPPEVPILPGVELAARYRPVGHDVEVGGDFYDVFAAGAGRWGVVIGDVSGKGVLAASLTALARYTVRAAARRETSASAVLEAVNSSILDDGAADDRFCTIAFAFVSHGPGGVELTVSCGGQPLPLLLDGYGRTRTVGEAGTAIGLFGDPSLSDAWCTLGPGESLVFYTDGVVEARSPDGTFADGLLEATLERCAGRPAEQVAQAIEDEVVALSGGRPRDDVAILVLRRPPETFSEHLVPGIDELPAVRRRLRSWLTARLGAERGLVDDVLLIANELITNAERVASTSVDVHVMVDVDEVTLDVSDDGPGFAVRLPPLVAPPADALAGRGLHIVSRLASRCDARSTSCGTLIRCVASRSAGSLA